MKKTPVVLFPGFHKTKLQVTVLNQTVAPECPASGTFEDWDWGPSSDSFSRVGRDKLMTLVYNHQPSVPMHERFSEQPGVTVTISEYGKIDSSPIYENFYAFFETNGYTRNLNIRVAGYDSRLTPDMGGFLQRTVELIERTYTNSENTPVHLVGHDSGAVYAQYLLTLTSQAWKNKYIHGFTPIAGTFPGTGAMTMMLFTGFNMNEASFPADTENAKSSALMYQSHPALYMGLADPAVFKKQEVVIQAGSATYTPRDYHKLFRDAGLGLAEELGKHYIGFVRYLQTPFFPNVDVYAEKQSGTVDTVFGVGLPDLTVGQLIGPSTQYFFLEDIDITNSINVWNQMKCFRFELTDNPGIDHVSIMSNPGVLGRLLMNLQRQRSICSEHWKTIRGLAAARIAVSVPLES